MCPKNHSNGADDSNDEEEEEQVADNGDEDEKQVWSRVQATASYGVRRIPLFHKRSGQNSGCYKLRDRATAGRR